MKTISRIVSSGIGAALTLAGLTAAPVVAEESDPIKHVLLISVDGLHEIDVRNYIHAHKNSAFERLQRHGVYYANASASLPSDSFPGLTALVTGASPRTAGIYYDDSYDRTLSPPGDLNCKTVGTETMYAENVDRSYDAVVLGGSTRLRTIWFARPRKAPVAMSMTIAPCSTSTLSGPQTLPTLLFRTALRSRLCSMRSRVLTTRVPCIRVCPRSLA